MADDYGSSTTTAGAVKVGGQITGEIEIRNDEDWFGVALNAGTTYWFDVLGKRGGGGTAMPTLSVLDPAGTYIRGVAVGGIGGDPLLQFTPLTSGTYYLSVTASSVGLGTYTLGAAIAPIADDFRDDIATTRTLAISSQVTGRIETLTDQDWFKVSLVAGSTYTFELRGVDGGGGTLGGGANDILLSLNDAAGDGVTNSYRGGAGDDPLITYTAIATGTHYLKVTGEIGAGTYTLSAAQGVTLANFLGGTQGNDVLTATAGSDLIAGAAGIDVVRFNGKFTDYAVSLDRFSNIITVAGRGTDKLHDVERLHFDDVGRAFDLRPDQNAGFVALARSAVFGETNPHNHRAEIGAGIKLLDGGMSYEAFAQQYLDSVLGSNPTNADVVTLLYTNVMHSPPPQKAMDFYKGLLDDHVVSTGWLAEYAAQHAMHVFQVFGIRPLEVPLYFDIV
jgi:hypothetical protein